MAESHPPDLGLLKVKELLNEVQVDYSDTSALDGVIEAIKGLLLQIPAEKVPWTYAKAFVKDLGVPVKKAKFCFQAIESLEVVGSYPLQVLVKPMVTIDLAIRIPKGCFLEKDYLNHRYHVKRGLYLCVIERSLRSSPIVKKIDWACFQHDARKPVLIVHPETNEGGGAVNFTLRLIPTISKDVFDKAKLAPHRNNVREAKSDRLEGTLQATPRYNASILEDMFVEEDSKLVQTAFSTSSNLREALVLLKVWMRQRNFYDCPDGFNAFLMSMFVFYLTSAAGGQRLMKHMTSLQVFKVTMESLANQHYVQSGIIMGHGSNRTKLPEAKNKLSQLSKFVWWNPSGYLNLSFRMNMSALQELKHEAVQTIAAMKSLSTDSGFTESFMVPIDFSAKYDCHVRLKLENVSEVPSGPCCVDEGRWRLFEENVEDLLREGLGGRAVLVRAVHRTVPLQWSLKQGLSNLGKGPLSIGILLSSFETAFRMVDIGPGADVKEEAAKFRAFWGEKSELRRFKDGKISETVAWECEPWERHLIPQEIVKYVLTRHLPIPPSNIEVVAGQLDFAIWQNGKDPAQNMPKLIEALDSFSKHLRSLESIPLKVSSISGLSSAFRHAAVIPPEPHFLARVGGRRTMPSLPVPACLDPLEIMIQLEGSGRWPSEPAALQKTKLAFSLQIASSFQKQWGIHSVPSEDAVDILWQGFAFRIRIFYEKDPSILRQDHGKAKLLASKSSVLSHSQPNEDLLLRSVHSSMLSGLQGSYPVYGPTVRLAKRWVASHLFSKVLAEEAIELLVAYVFLRPSPFSSPNSRVSGFLRFLRLIANYDWTFMPLIVDINGDFDAKQHQHIMSLFYASRETATRTPQASEDEIVGPAMYVVTPYDLESLTWTKCSPSFLELRRIVAYARSSTELLKDNIYAGGDKWQSLFRTPLHCYNVLILLQRKALPFPNRILFAANVEAEAVISAKSYEGPPLAYLPLSVLKSSHEEARKDLLIGFDPVSGFIAEVKAKYGDMFSIWYDGIGSDVIGLTFNRNGTDFKAINGKRKRVENCDNASDLNEIVHNIFEMGHGLVRSVHVVNKK